jgi:lactate dehydrogenase-like 2-hydroxyacid dehydrogenase
MTSQKLHQADILVLTPLPADLRVALERDYNLVDYDKTARPLKAVTGVAIAVTRAMAGADAATMEALPDLKLIASMGAGLERIDLAEAHRRGIAISHTPDVLTEDVADFAIGLMYAVGRRIVEIDRFVRAGKWPMERPASSRRLHGKVAGIVGLGRIGEAIARRAAGLGMTVEYFGHHAKPLKEYEYVADVLSLAKRSDVLFLACKGDETTRNLVDASVLDALGPEGILVNIARGSIVDEVALIDALAQRKIMGAGLDVFMNEPNIDSRFLSFENVVLSAHYASMTVETRAAIIGKMLHDIAAFRTGARFVNAALPPNLSR